MGKSLVSCFLETQCIVILGFNRERGEINYIYKQVNQLSLMNPRDALYAGPNDQCYRLASVVGRTTTIASTVNLVQATTVCHT